MTVLERREQALRRIARTLHKVLPAPPVHTAPADSQKKLKRKRKNPGLWVDFAENESLPYTSPEQHHHMSHSRNFYLNISHFLSENQGDPAINVRL
jgi:hypothetical protein